MKVLLAEKIMQKFCRADWTSHNIGIFIHKKSSGQVDFLFQPVTCKGAEKKRAGLKETFYLNS